MTTHTFNARPNPRRCAVLAITVLLAASAQAQRIDVQPGPDVLVGTPLQIVLSGVPPTRK